MWFLQYCVDISVGDSISLNCKTSKIFDKAGKLKKWLRATCTGLFVTG